MMRMLMIEIFYHASWSWKRRIRLFPQSKWKKHSTWCMGITITDIHRALLVWTSSNITAGSDTTAILLRTIFYNLLRHPETLEKLLDELVEAATRGELDELASWKQTRDLPYLDSCIKEAGRLHPPFGLPLERVVPPEGAAICGQWIPGGTIVGMSGWVVHRNQEVFGEDCDDWRPERWLCDPEPRKMMESSLLTVSTDCVSVFVRRCANPLDYLGTG